MPHLKTAYAKYQNDPNVVFLLVSIDEDAKRLQRYLDEMKFAFPVARAPAAQAEQAMRFDNIPATFYVDRSGIVRATDIDPDYRYRPDPLKTIDDVKALK